MDCRRKFRNFKGSSFVVRRIADHLCLENGLSIIAEPKPSRGSYANWQGDEKPPTNRERLEQMIDAALENANDFDGFIAEMKKAGCVVKHNKNLSFKILGAKRPARCSSLGEDYSEEAIRERLAGLRKVARRQPATTSETAFVPFVITRETKFSLLIDIQKKIREGKGEAYESWAMVYNLKQAAHTLIYLQENGIDSYDELVKKTVAASSGFNEKLDRMKDIETRQKEISALQYQIGHYGKTRETYKRYIASGRDRDFYESERADITLYQAAKKYFDEHGYGKNKKLPSINMLKQEWAALEAERKKLYHGYRELKDRRTELIKARDNVERFLGINRNAPERQRERRHISLER